MNTANNNIGIVILNYCTWLDTLTLVHSLQKQTVAERLHIVVVDNASPNGSYQQLQHLEKQYANVTLLQTGENMGYARGNNYGLRYLEEHRPPRYVAITNNDIQLPKNCFEQLAAAYGKLDKPAFIAPLMLTTKGEIVNPPRKRSFIDDCLNMFLLYRLLSPFNTIKILHNAGGGICRVPIIPGSFIFSTFPTFRDIGYFYPHTFLFAEERFIAAEVEKAGLSNYLLTNLSYIHHHSKTINTHLSLVNKHRYLYNGCIRYTCKYRTYGKTKALILRFLSCFSLFEIRLVYLLMGKTGKIKHIKKFFQEK